MSTRFISKNADKTPSGETLTIKAKGDFKEKIEEGAKVHLQVKYGLITLINQEADLCETIENVDLSCPLDKGEMTLSKDVDLPKEIPPVRFDDSTTLLVTEDANVLQGTYTVLADVFTKDGDKITCLTAKIAFHR